MLKTDQPMAKNGRPAPERHRYAEAFTLIELLVVLVIMALALAVTPIFLSNDAPTINLKTASREIASAIRLTQSEAIKQNREVVFVLDVDARQYTIGEGGRQGAVSRDLTLELYTAQDERLDKSKAGIRFFPDGSSTGGKITISNGARSYKVAINWLTGKVTIGE